MNLWRATMTKSSLLGVFCGCVAVFCGITNAHAALVSRLGGQAVYDTDLDITWLADANLAASEQFGVTEVDTTDFPGIMLPVTVPEWIAAMNADGGTGYLGFNSWRVPTALNPDGSFCSGYNCTLSEMGHLFYVELDGTAQVPILESTDPALALFSNIQSDAFYGAGPLGSDPCSFGLTGAAASEWVCFFGFANIVWEPGNETYAGLQDYGEGDSVYVWPVADGDPFVPIPPAAWLFGSGLLGLIGIARRKKAA
jgi:hypothetical protein